MKTRPTTTNKPLTKKQQAFVQHLVNNPKDSATDAVKAVYNVSNINSSTARTIASENLAKPNIVSALAQYNNLVENTLINTVNDYKDSDKLGERALAIDTAKYIHDKVNGKATQRIEQQSTSVNFSIDLSQAMQELEAIDAPQQG